MATVEAKADIITARNHSHSLFLRLPAELRNTIYRFTMGRSPVHIIERMDYLDGLQAQVALLQVCRQMYHEAVPLVLGLRQLVLGNYSVPGHGKRMMKVLDRILKCPLSGHIRAMTFKVEQSSVIFKNGELKLGGHLKDMAKKLRKLQGLRTVTVLVAKKCGRLECTALKMQLQQELCDGRDICTVDVQKGGQYR